MPSAREHIAAVVAELDADGSGFHTREAVSLLFHRVADGLDLPPETASLLRMGCQAGIKSYQPTRAAAKRLGQRLAAGAGQIDFMEVEETFEHWVQDFAALDESQDAVRKRFLRMTLPELRQVIALAERKADETRGRAMRLRDIILQNPGWEDSPSTTLAEILGVGEVP